MAEAVERRPRRVTARRHDGGLERLPHLGPALGAGGPAQAHDADDEIVGGGQVLVDEGGVGLRVVREMHARRRVRARPADQVLVHLLGDERRERREETRHRFQAPVEGVVGGVLIGVVLALPEPATAPPHVPVRQVVHEGLNRSGAAGRVEVVERPRDVADERLELGERPPVELGALVHRRRGTRGVEAVDVGVGDEEGVGVPQREQEGAHRLGDEVG